MEQRQTISQIAECVISEMERMQYSPATISTFRVKAKQLSRYVQEKTGTDYFTEELGRRYLADTIGFPFAENRWLTSPEASHIRCVRRIGEAISGERKRAQAVPVLRERQASTTLRRYNYDNQDE